MCDISFSQLPRHCIKDDELAISISKEEYAIGLESCKSHLHGRLLLTKGANPIKIEALKSKLQYLWHLAGMWDLISLGKGYYEFSFSSIEDSKRIQSQPS